MADKKGGNQSSSKMVHGQKYSISNYPNLRDVSFFQISQLFLNPGFPVKSTRESVRGRQSKTAKEARGNKETEKKTPVQPAPQYLSASTVPHQYSDQYFQITEPGVNHRSVLWTKVTQDRLAVRSSDPPRGGRLWAPVWPGLP